MRHNIRLSCSTRMGKKIVLFGAVGLFISLAIAGLASVAPGVFGWLTFAILVSASNCEPRRSMMSAGPFFCSAVASATVALRF